LIYRRNSGPAPPKQENKNRISGRFEPLRCLAFITESTFGLPIYRWRPQAEIAVNNDSATT